METMDEVQKTTFVNRREYERVPFLKRLTVRDVDTGQKFRANGIDISVKGVGFFCKKFFPKESRVSLQIWLDDDGQKDPIWINATVKRAQLEQNGAIIGVQFDNLVKPAEHPKLYEMIYKVVRLLLLGLTIL